MGFRAKLFLISVSLTLLVVFASGAVLQRSLHRWVVARVRGELERHAQTSMIALKHYRGPTDLTAMDALADELGQSTNTHVILLDGSGQLLGDSRLSLAQLKTASPMSIQALERRVRGDMELEPQDELVLAMAIPRADLSGYLYMTVPLNELELVITRVRVLMLIATLIGLAAAIFMSGLSAHMMSRTLRRLAQRAQALISGSRMPGLEDPPPQDDLNDISLSITRLANAMAESMEAIARERDRFEVVLESMEEAVLALDGQHGVTLLNQAALALLAPQVQVLDGPVVGTRVTELLPIPALLPLLEQADQGVRSVAELTLPGPPEHVVMAHVTPRKNHAGAVMVLRDVTALRRLERVRRDFVTNVSHELRTPVSVIMANSETLLQDHNQDPIQAQRFIQAMHRNAERLSRLISDLLDISRLESGRFRLQLEPISVFGAVLKVMDVLEEKIEAKAQEVELDVDLDLLVYADAKALDQILYNLIDNASKYTPKDGLITIRATRDEDTILLKRAGILVEIVDNGPGLTPEQRTRIFERFYRVDTGRSRDVGGTGLGLAIVKHLATAMHGRVGVKPNSPQGSVFWVRLPEARPEDEIAVDMAKAVEVVEEGLVL